MLPLPFAGLIDMAVKKNVLIGGDDFKSGQTKLKSVLVDYLVRGSCFPAQMHHVWVHSSDPFEGPDCFCFCYANSMMLCCTYSCSAQAGYCTFTCTSVPASQDLHLAVFLTCFFALPCRWVLALSPCPL